MKYLISLTVFIFYTINKLVCQISRKCNYPDKPLHGIMSFSAPDYEITANTTVIYSCEAGFEIIGKSKRSCFGDGTWNGVSPKCVANVALLKSVTGNSRQSDLKHYNINDGSLTTCLKLRKGNGIFVQIELIQAYFIIAIRIYGPDVKKDFLIVELTNSTNTKIPCIQTSSSDGEDYLEYKCPQGNPAKIVIVQAPIFSTIGSQFIKICEINILSEEEISVMQCMNTVLTDQMEKAVFNRVCYYIQNQRTASFNTANDSCFSATLTPPRITSRNINKFLASVLYRYQKDVNKYWIGVYSNISSMNPSTTSWHFFDGTIITNPIFSSNKFGTINNLNCAAIDGLQNWMWSDFPCSDEYCWICEKYPYSCGSPDQNENSYITTQIFQVGSYIYYRCQVGFHLTGSEMRMCKEDGTWSGFAPTCEYIDCGPLGNICNGKLSVPSGTGLGNLAEYFCKPGYKLKGNSIRWCLENGSWSGIEPICEQIILSFPVRCDLPEELLNGIYLFVNGTVSQGSFAKYDCLEGYILEGEDLIHCQSDGTWNHGAPLCNASIFNDMEQRKKDPVEDAKTGNFFVGLAIGLSILLLCFLGIILAICIFRNRVRKRKKVKVHKDHTVDIVDEDGNIYDTVTLNSDKDYTPEGKSDNRRTRNNSYFEDNRNSILQDNKLYENLSFPKTPIKKPPRKTSNVVLSRTSGDDDLDNLNSTTITVLSQEEGQPQGDQDLIEMPMQQIELRDQQTVSIGRLYENFDSSESEMEDIHPNLPDVACNIKEPIRNENISDDNKDCFGENVEIKESENL